MALSAQDRLIIDVINQIEQESGQKLDSNLLVRLQKIGRGFPNATVEELGATLRAVAYEAGVPNKAQEEADAAASDIGVDIGQGDRTSTGGGTTGGGEEASVIQRLVTERGLSEFEAELLIDQEGVIGALEFLGDPAAGGSTGGGGGGGGTATTPGQLENQRLNNALLQRELDSNPYLQVGTDNTTGRSFLIDTQTGQRTDIGQTDFAGVDPERVFQNDINQFNAQENRLGQTAQNQSELQRQQLVNQYAGEDRLRQALGLDSQIAQGNLDLGISQEDRLRQALGLDAQVAQGQFDVQRSEEDRLRQALGLQRDTSQANVNLGANQEDRLRNALGADVQATNQQADQFRFEQLREVLANPSDFLARAFLQRGQTSPSGQVTQADLLNALRTEIRDVEAPQYNQTIQQLLDSSQIGEINYQTGLPNVQIDQPQFQTGLPTNNITSPTYDTNVNDLLSQLMGLDLTVPTTNVSNPLPTQQAPAQQAPQLTPERAALEAQLPNANPIDASIPDSFLQEILRADAAQRAAGAAVQSPQPTPTGTTAPTSTYTPPASTLPNYLLNPETAAVAYGYAQGGHTRLPMFITGDSPSGKPTGNEEMILNPTNAPISVVPNPKNMPGNRLMSRFAYGTAGTNPLETMPGDIVSSINRPAAPTAEDRLREAGVLPTATEQFSNTAAFPPGGTANTPGGITQDQIIQYAQDFSPPAVSGLFNGGQIPGLRFGFPLFTPQQLNQLTSDETQALQTRLGAEFNTTLADVTKAQQQRFGGTRQRSRGRLQL